jgi:hypothetical protein
MAEQAPEGRAKNVGLFMGIMREQPLSLALVVMNFVLLGYLFYSGSSNLTQRSETSTAIIKWQEATDKLMASCVSADIMKLVLEAVKPPPPAEPK